MLWTMVYGLPLCVRRLGHSTMQVFCEKARDWFNQKTNEQQIFEVKSNEDERAERWRVSFERRPGARGRSHLLHQWGHSAALSKVDTFPMYAALYSAESPLRQEIIGCTSMRSFAWVGTVVSHVHHSRLNATFMGRAARGLGPADEHRVQAYWVSCESLCESRPTSQG